VEVSSSLLPYLQGLSVGDEGGVPCRRHCCFGKFEHCCRRVGAMSSQELKLPAESKSYIQKELKRYEQRESALIPALFESKKVIGWIAQDVISLLAHEMDIPVARVAEVANFYTMFNKKPVGKYHIQVCTNISCAMVGARETMSYICQKTGVK